jgi:hypothetical protein
MKKGVCSIICICVAFILGSKMSLNASEDRSMASLGELELNIEMTKNAYRLLEHIPLKISFSNVSKDSFYLNTAFNLIEKETRLSLNVKTRAGEFIPMRTKLVGKRSSLNKEDFHLLSVGDEYHIEILLNNWCKLEKPDEYIVSASYYNSNDGKKYDLRPFWKFWSNVSRAWMGKSCSNEVSFRIIG